MDTFSPPGHDPGEGDVDLDEVPTPGMLSYAAAIAGVGSGLFGAVYAIQLILFIIWTTWAGYVPYVQLALCSGVLVTAGLATRMRPGFSIAFASLAGAQLLFAVVWTIYVFLIPIVTGLGILWPLLTVPTALLAPAVIPPALRAASFRRRLLE